MAATMPTICRVDGDQYMRLPVCEPRDRAKRNVSHPIPSVTATVAMTGARTPSSMIRRMASAP